MAQKETTGLASDLRAHSVAGVGVLLATNDWRESLLRRMLAAGDILAVLFGALSLGFIIGSNVNAFFWAVVLAPMWVVLAKLLGLYDRDQRALRHLTIDEAPRLAAWAALGSLGVMLFFRLPVPGSLPAMDAVHLAVVTLVSVVVIRGATRRLWRGITPRERTVLIGSGPEAEAFLRKVELFPEVHLEVVEMLQEVDIEAMRHSDGWWDAVDRIVVASAAADAGDISQLITLAQEHHVRLSVIPLTRSLSGTAVQLSRIADLTVLEYRTWAIPRSTLLLKRILDIVLGSIALVLLSPLFVLIAIAIKLDSRGPVIYSQMRAGLRQQPFRMLKFRTMVKDAEQQLEGLVPFDKLAEPMFKIENDPRVTRVGRFLRRSSLDETLQLLNLLKGDMSLVWTTAGAAGSGRALRARASVQAGGQARHHRSDAGQRPRRPHLSRAPSARAGVHREHVALPRPSHPGDDTHRSD